MISLERKRELNRAAMRRWRARNPEKVKSYAKQWRIANPERIKEIENRASAKKYKKNPEKIKARNAVWKKANPEKCRVHRENYRARKEGAEGFYTPEDVERILCDQNGTCAAPFCNIDVTENGHVDHIEALSRGGTNWPDNLQVLCPSCNKSKCAKEYEDWIKENIE